MPRLAVLSGKEVARILERNGFEYMRTNGSHQIYKRSEKPRVTVSVPNHDFIRQGTLGAIIEQSGLPRSLFEIDQ